MAFNLSEIRFSTLRKQHFQFKHDTYNKDDALYDILIFKDYLGKVVPKDLYILPPTQGLSRASNSADVPAQRSLSTSDGGNRFDLKMLRAVKAYQLLNRGKILRYRRDVLEENVEFVPDTDMSLQQVLRIYTSNETNDSTATVSGQYPQFAANFGCHAECFQ